jgi:hypothetical protein
MNDQPQIDDYFSQSAIRERVTQRHQRKQGFRVHVFLTLIVSLGITFLVMLETDVFLPNNTLNGTAILLGLLKAALASSVFWLFLLFHVYVKHSREYLAAEIDAEMNKAREYELRRYELDRDHNHDATYRLSDDGELFYDAEEMEYDLKPKRKRIE